MVNYVERATLILRDETSANAKKINAQLKALFTTAKKLQGTGGGSLKFTATGTSAVSKSILKLNNDLGKLKSAGGALPKITVKVDSSQVQLAIARLGALKKVASSPIVSTLKAPVVAAAGGGGGRGRGGNGSSLGALPPVSPRGAGSLVATIPASSWTPMKAILAGFAERIGADISRAIATAAGKGLKDLDVASTRLRTLGATPKEIQTLNQSATIVSAGTNGNIGAAKIMSTAAEVFPDIRHLPGGDQRAVLAEMARLETAMVANGMNAEKANAGMAAVFKTMSNKQLVLNDDGALRKDINDQFTSFAQMMLLGGAESSPEKLNTIFKHTQAAGTAAGIVSKQFIAFVGEDIGAMAGTAFNALSRNLAGGRRTPRATENLEDLGMMETNASGERVLKSESLFKTDLVAWAKKEFLPVIKREQDKAVAENAKLPAKNQRPEAEVRASAESKTIGKITSDRTAESFLTALSTNMDEFQRRLDQLPKLETSQQGLNAILDTVTAGLNRFNTSLETAAGGITASIGGRLVPALDLITGGITTFGNAFRGLNGKGEEQSRADSASTIMLGSIGALGTALAGLKVASFLNPLNAVTTAVGANVVALNANTAALGGKAIKDAADVGGKVAAGGTAAAAGGGIFAAARAAAIGAVPYLVPAAAGIGAGIIIGAGKKQAGTFGMTGAEGAKHIAGGRSLAQIRQDSFREGVEADKAANLSGDQGSGVLQAIKDWFTKPDTDAARLRLKARSDAADERAKRGAAILNPVSSAKADEMPKVTLSKVDPAVVSILSEASGKNANDELRNAAKPSSIEGTSGTSGLTDEGTSVFSAAAQKLATTLDGYQAVFTAGAAKLVEAGPQFGQGAGTGVLAFAGQFGAIAGAAIAAAAGNISINVKSSSGGPNLGSSKPQE